MQSIKFMLLSLLMVMFVQASDEDLSDNELFGEQLQKANAPLIDDADEHTQPLVDSSDISLMNNNSVEEKSDSQAESWAKNELSLALKHTGFQAGAATLFLSNSFGRLVLLGFLGYKAVNSLKKCINDKEKRNQHVVKACSYLAAVLMLSQDGYLWVLHNNA